MKNENMLHNIVYLSRYTLITSVEDSEDSWVF